VFLFYQHRTNGRYYSRQAQGAQWSTVAACDETFTPRDAQNRGTIHDRRHRHNSYHHYDNPHHCYQFQISIVIIMVMVHSSIPVHLRTCARAPVTCWLL